MPTQTETQTTASAPLAAHEVVSTAAAGTAAAAQDVPPAVDHLDRHGYLFGKKLAASLSPLLHDVVYRSLGLHWGQVRLDSADVAAFLRLLRDPRCYGASVTMPNKVAVLPFLDRCTPEASAVGACNTVYFDEEEDAQGRMRRLLCGANTDTVGVRDAFAHNLSAAELATVVRGRPALIVGGGGAARSAVYALRRWLGVTAVYVVNRDAAEVAAVLRDLQAADFGTDDIVHVATVAQAQALPPVGAAVGCVPDLPPASPAEVAARQVTEALLAKGPGVLLEMCYNPSPYTALGALAGRHGWQVILGTEALIYQGLEQDRYWTRRSLDELPVQQVKQAIEAHLLQVPKA